MMIHAAEDVGLADPQALQVATNAALAVERVGMPEAQIILSEAAMYIACAPKDVYKRQVYHGVKIMDNALVSAAVLSNRYISDRFLPDKAIDLVDEACALIKTELDSMPTELDELRRKVLQMEIEETALKKEDDRLSQERLETLQKELAELREEYSNRMAQWENEKASIEKLHKIREEIDNVNNQIEIAQREGDYEKLSELSYSTPVSYTHLDVYKRQPWHHRGGSCTGDHIFGKWQ